jgi:hypothetical protein
MSVRVLSFHPSALFLPCHALTNEKTRKHGKDFPVVSKSEVGYRRRRRRYQRRTRFSQRKDSSFAWIPSFESRSNTSKTEVSTLDNQGRTGVCCRASVKIAIIQEKDLIFYSSQAGLLLFSIVFIGLVLVGATFFSAESARLADEGVLHSIHQQVRFFSPRKSLEGS